MNDKIKQALSDMAAFEDFNGRVFPAKAYRNALRAVSELDFEIDDAEQIKGTPSIGAGIYAKIDSLLKTGTFPRYEEYKSSAAAKIKDMAAIKGGRHGESQAALPERHHVPRAAEAGSRWP